MLQQAQRLFGVGKRIRKLGGHSVAAVAEAAAACRQKWQAAVTKEERDKGTAKPEVCCPPPPPSPQSSSLPVSLPLPRPPCRHASPPLPAGKGADGRHPPTSQAAKAKPAAETAAPSKEEGEEARKPGAAGGAPGGARGAGPGDAAGEMAKVVKTGDPGRDRVRELFQEGLLKAAEQFPGKDSGIIASDIEEALFALFEPQGGSKSKDYKAKARSLMFNLRDEKNPDLRSSVLSGDIMPAALVKLEPKDLASKHMKERNARIVEEMTRNAMGPSANVESTDQFQCGKCKQRKCTYYQMQTRSADEPMTTFVTCIVCNNRWKFC